MKIINCEVKNFRSIQNLTTSTQKVNAIFGPNGCGKSNLMRALRFAFVRDYQAERMTANICNSAQSANAAARVSLRFSMPTKRVARILNLKHKSPFSYTVSVKRNGSTRFYVNGADLPIERRKEFIEEILIINVPAIRDVETDGLQPLRQAFVDVLNRTRGPQSLVSHQETLRRFLEKKGNRLLKNTHTSLHGADNIDGFVLNAGALDILELIDKIALQVEIGNERIDIDKVGTGYQSSLIIQSYRQLGAGIQKPILFFFEEPDNHLHPTSMRAMADQLNACGGEALSQVFFTTHSPYLLNQFSPNQGIGLKDAPPSGTVPVRRRIERSDRELRIALARYGLTASEASLVKSTVVTEGLLDCHLIRTLVELERGKTCDQLDISIIPAGGKSQVSQLALLLRELGLTPLCIFDWDATVNGNLPYFSEAALDESADELKSSLNLLLSSSNTHPSGRKTKLQKSLEAMKQSLNSPRRAAQGQFKGSVLHDFLSKHGFRKRSDEARIETFAKRHQIQNLRNELVAYSAWIWKDTPELGLIRDLQSAKEAEKILLHSGIIARSPPGTEDLMMFIRNKVHQLAHEPLILSEIIQSLWQKGLLNNSEPKKLVNHILSYS